MWSLFEQILFVLSVRELEATKVGSYTPLQVKPLLYVWSPGGHILLQSRIFFFRLSWNFISARFGPLGVRNCNKKFVCLSCECVCLSNEICHRPSGHSFGPICMNFGTLVYLWDTLRHSRFLNSWFFQFLLDFWDLAIFWGAVQTTFKSKFYGFYGLSGLF